MPEALRLADELERYHGDYPTCTESAAELRRLSAVEAQRKPLSEEEVEQCFRAAGITVKGPRWTNAVRNVERAHGIGEQP